MTCVMYHVLSMLTSEVIHTAQILSGHSPMPMTEVALSLVAEERCIQ